LIVIPRFYFYRCEADGEVIGVVALRTWWPDPVQAIREAKAGAAAKLGKDSADVRLIDFRRI
jgi:hypothetical protein